MVEQLNKLLMVDQVILDNRGSQTLSNGLKVSIQPTPDLDPQVGDLWFNQGSYFEWNGEHWYVVCCAAHTR